MRKGRKNLFEELGRVEGEHSNKNRRAEVSRIHGELNKGYKKGGRAAFKHGKFVKVATPHADIAKYVEKDSSKSPKHYRKEGSTLKMDKRKGGRRGLSPAATRRAKATGYTGRTPVVEVKREGPRNEKFNVKIKKASGGRIGLKRGSVHKPGSHSWYLQHMNKKKAKKASGGRIGLSHGGSVGAAIRGRGAEIK